MTGIPHQPGCGQASLPMYDWPEERSATDGFWQQIRDRVRLQEPNITLPENLTSVDGDPAPHWRAERPVFSQSCWGPLEAGFLTELRPLAQPDYSAFEGGDGPLYRSVLVTRDGPVAPVPAGQGASALQDVLQGWRFGFNNPTSLSGLIAPARDLGISPAALMKTSVETGSHRASVRAVADGTIDVAAIDCRSWMLACRHEPAAARLVTAGWTALRPGLPYVTSCHTAPDIRAALTAALISLGCFAVG